jgi:DNA-binding response OmpR family regulator
MVMSQLRAEKIATSALISNVLSNSDRAIALRNAGADDFVTKPFDLGQLSADAKR